MAEARAVSSVGLEAPALRGAGSKCYITRGATPCKPLHRDTLDLPIEWQYPKTRGEIPLRWSPHKVALYGGPEGPCPFGASFWPSGASFWPSRASF